MYLINIILSLSGGCPTQQDRAIYGEKTIIMAETDMAKGTSTMGLYVSIMGFLILYASVFILFYASIIKDFGLPAYETSLIIGISGFATCMVLAFIINKLEASSV